MELIYTCAETSKGVLSNLLKRKLLSLKESNEPACSSYVALKHFEKKILNARKLTHLNFKNEATFKVVCILFYANNLL